MGDTMKLCPKCKKMKHFTEFHKSNIRKDGFKCYCKECRKQYHKDNAEHENRKVAQWRKDNPVKQKLNNIEHAAKYREHNWDIPKDVGYCLISSPCAYCGQIQENFNGLDRIDSNKDYVVDNVTPCCKRCNQAKNDMSVEKFKNHITKIYKYKR